MKVQFTCFSSLTKVSLFYVETVAKAKLNLKLFLSLSLLLLFTFSLQAQTTVCPSGCDFTSIQAAIDAATDGDVINIYPGNYIENATFNTDNVGLLINKEVTLQGVDNSDVDITNRANIAATISATSPTTLGTSFIVTADNVSFIGLEFVGARMSNDRIRGAIDVVGADNFTIDNCIVSAESGAVSVFGALRIRDEVPSALADPDNFVSDISTYTINDNELRGFVFLFNGAGWGATSPNLAITNNDFVNDPENGIPNDGIVQRGVIESDAFFNAPAAFPTTVTGNTFASDVEGILRARDEEISRLLDLAYLQNFISNNTLPKGVYITDGSALRFQTAGPSSNPFNRFDILMDISTAITRSSDNDVIEIAAGTYDGPISINKEGLTLNGSGTGAILNGGGENGVTVSADNVTINNIHTDGFDNGIELNSVDGTTLTNSSFENSTNGLKVSNEASVTNLTVQDCTFDNNTFGWYITCDDANDCVPTFDGIDVSTTTFNNNTRKGLYIEKLNNAMFDNITVDGSGTDTNWPTNNGIDINLKWTDYSDITISNSSIINSGVKGTSSGDEADAAVAIKARDDAPSYNTTPATLDNVTFTGNVVSGPQNGLRFGEFDKTNNGPTNIVVNNNDFSHAFANDALTYNVDGVELDANCNWWGTISGPQMEDITEVTAGTVNATPWLVNSDLDNPDCSGTCSAVSPSNLMETNITDNSADLTWDEVYEATAYQVWTSSGGFVNVGNVTSYTLTGLDMGTSYSWNVRAICMSGGRSDLAERQSFVTTGMVMIDLCPSTPPSNLSTTNIANTSADLNWNPVAGAVSYQVWTSSGGFVNVGNVTSYTLTGLDMGTSYSWNVRAICMSGGRSDLAERQSFVTTGMVMIDLCPSTPPSNLATINISSTSAQLTWDAVDGASSYDVWNSVEGRVNVGNVTSYTLNSLAPNTAYSWNVRAICSGGDNSAYGDRQEFVTSNSIGGMGTVFRANNQVNIGNKLVNPDVMIYPNPARNYVMIQGQSSEVINSIILYDLTGRIIQQIDRIEANQYELRLNSQLSNGIYMLRISGDGFTKTKRLSVTQ